MSDLTERVARAIFEGAPAELARGPFDQASSLAKRMAFAQAEAALNVLRAEADAEDEYEAELARVVRRIKTAPPAHAPSAVTQAPRPRWALSSAIVLLAAGAAGLILAFLFSEGVR
jgi:hypothetical protein